MSRYEISRRTQRNRSRTMQCAVTHGGACVATALALLIGSQVFAQAPPPPGASTAGPPGTGVTMSSDPKLLAPLPPPSADALKRNPPSSDPRNLEGVWLAEPRPFPGAGFDALKLPFTDSGKQRLKRLMQRAHDADAQGKVLLTDAGRCRPMPNIGVGTELFPMEIIQMRDKIVILQEEGRTRWVIHMNGEQPKNVTPSYFGHSQGRWEADTLVVETVGLRASDGMAGMGMHSDKARIVSRLRKTDGGSKLELISTTHDSQTYTQPFEGRMDVAIWHPELSFLEFQCEENSEGAREGMVE